MTFFDPYMEQIRALCRQHKVARLSAFGSSVKGALGPESDIDLLVELIPTDPHEYSDHYFALYDQLEDLFRRPVDLVEQRALRNKYFIQDLNTHKVDLYAA
ncbi:MAG: nucleotidyltransferase domain-containing protein [Flavobacteriales bacterium]|nr:nucleotidyltransferase domain-containing protein [Flavobacteriales bacterium]